MEYKREESQPQASDIDPRLQESVPPQLYPPPPITYVPNDVRLPPPPQQQQQYSDPSHWPQDGYNQYYGSPPNQQGAPNPQTHNYQAYQANFEAPSQPTEGGVSETKRSRACEACRGLKVRCEPDAGNGPCKRCTKAGRNCVTTAPSRKRQKKTDTRVAELERKIDALTATLHATKDGNNFSGSDEVDYAEEETSHLDSAGHRLSQHIPPYPMTTGTGRKRRMSDYPQDSDSGTSPEAMRYNPLPNPASVGSGLYMDIVAAAAIANNDHPKAGTAVYHDADVVGRGRVSRETANRLFTHYTMYMAPHMPIVAFPSDITAEAVREKSPILFLAILSVASGQDYADLQADLTKDIMRILADRVFVSGEKSLEIIQALQVVAIWYWPEPNGDSKYYQLIHMTAIMAIDLGIDRKQTQKKKDILDIPKPKSYLADPDTIECRRAWVGCYLLCSSVAMGMKRPNLIHPNPYIADCAKVLKSSEDSLQSDTFLCRWTQLQVLADDLAAQISSEEDTVLSVRESKARSAYNVFKKQVTAWESHSLSGDKPPSLLLASHVVNLYMYELAMQHSTSIDPATAVSTQGRPQTRISPSETAGQNSQPLISIYGILDTFLDLGIQDIRTLPVFQFAQIAHASVSLQKMYNYAKYDPSYSKQLPVSARMVEQYLSRLIEALRAGAEQGKSLPAHSFLMVITAVRALFNQYKDMDLDEIRAVYHGMFPGTSQIQILDLQEPTPTPQNPPRRSKSSTDGALHLLSEAAMGKSKGSSYKADEAQTSGPQAVPEGGNMRAMGKLLVPSGGGKLGVIGDDGFFDIIHEMATKAS